MKALARYRDAHVGGCVEALIEQRADGSTLLRSTEALRWFPARLSDCLEQWAAEAPARTFAARRGRDGALAGEWQRVSYAQMLQRAQAIGQALVDLGLSPERPLAILSGNDLEHLSLAMGALWAGVPYVPVSTAYSLVSQDFGKLRHILRVTQPGLVFASGPEYARAIAATVDAGVPLLMTEGGVEGRAVRAFSELLDTEPGPTLAAAHARVGPDSIAKILFTSGSTKLPKGVINTHRMLCANQQMLRQCLRFLADEPPVLVDWLPWNHTFGGSHNVGITLYNGGTLYIDDGKPTPAGIAETLRNLREISPTIYFNVPKGLEEIARAMDHDTQLRDTLFKRCKAFMFAGAALSQAVWDQMDGHAEAAVGERVRIITGLGMTETAPSCTFAVGTDVASGHIGLPAPGVEVKLVRDAGTGDKIEIRFRGPNVMPGYWRLPEETAAAFDDEGFYRSGDAARWIDPAQPPRGLLFDGRTAEDFKLSSGTFVSVGPLRAKITLLGDPCVQDAVITGINRDEVGALLFPRADECRRLACLPAATPLPEVLHHPAVRAFFQQLADRLWREATGSASRVTRLHVLAEPPSIDKGEVTDKGSINQRAVLQHRDALVEALYEGASSDPFLILPNPS
ncbi:MAG: feruloyl-CoA synthase [Rubrivivax sp.]|nr:feruloyl-CoA synthase [Rubrivivax sp.]